MQNLLKQVGYYCQKGYKISVLQSAAGYYIGTAAEDGPNCRLKKLSKDELKFIKEHKLAHIKLVIIRRNRLFRFWHQEV